MRIDCKHYETRTYSSGEVVRMCRIDLAPEAPWRCPEDCPGFERKTFVGWESGSLAESMTSEPEVPTLDENTSFLLDQAEDIINSAGVDIVAQVKEERARIEAERPGLIKKLFRRKPKPR